MKCTFRSWRSDLCARPRRRRCSCGNFATLECDAPVKRDARWSPKVGDVGFHVARRVVYYVRAVVSGSELEVSTRPRGGKPQRISVVTWLEKTMATCDRPVCRECVVRPPRSGLDLCAAHGRELVQAAERKLEAMKKGKPRGS